MNWRTEYNTVKQRSQAQSFKIRTSANYVLKPRCLAHSKPKHKSKLVHFIWRCQQHNLNLLLLRLAAWRMCNCSLKGTDLFVCSPFPFNYLSDLQIHNMC